jgi:beta-lactamase regulating signal transducer with metallopeptidase domain
MTFDFVWNPFWQRTSAVLVHFVWQAAAAAVLVGLLVAVWQPKRPDVRYRIYLVTFLALPCGALLTFLIATAAERPTGASRMMPKPPGVDEWTAGVSAESGAAGSVSESTSVLSSLTRRLDPARPWLIPGWLTGVGLFSLRLVCGAAAIAWIRRRAAAAPIEVLDRVRMLSGKLAVRIPHVVASRHVRQALAAGLFRPVIVLPASWATGLSPDMAEAVLAHELAHLRRHDVWLNAVQRIVEAVFFYHPAVWWLSNRVRAERELCCDELAVAATGNRLAYATALEMAVRDSCPARGLILANGIGGRQMAVLERVRHVLNLEPGGRQRGWWAGVAALAVPALVWCAAAEWQPAQAENAEIAFVQDGERENDEVRGEREERDGDARGSEEARREDARREEAERRENEIERNVERIRGREPGIRIEFERRGDPAEDEDREGAERRRWIERREYERRSSDAERVGDRDPRDGGDPRPRNADRDDAQSFPRGPEFDPPREWPRESRYEIEFERRGGMAPPQRELLEMVRELRREVDELRREVRDLRENRQDRPIPPVIPRLGGGSLRSREGDRDDERRDLDDRPGPDGPNRFPRRGFDPPMARERDDRDRADDDRDERDDPDNVYRRRLSGSSSWSFPPRSFRRPTDGERGPEDDDRGSDRGSGDRRDPGDRPRPPDGPGGPLGPPRFRPPREREEGEDRPGQERPDADRERGDDAREGGDDAREPERDRPNGGPGDDRRPDGEPDADQPERDGETDAVNALTPSEVFSFFLGFAR